MKCDRYRRWVIDDDSQLCNGKWNAGKGNLEIAKSTLEHGQFEVTADYQETGILKCGLPMKWNFLFVNFQGHTMSYKVIQKIIPATSRGRSIRHHFIKFRFFNSRLKCTTDMRIETTVRMECQQNVFLGMCSSHDVRQIHIKYQKK